MDAGSHVDRTPGTPAPPGGKGSGLEPQGVSAGSDDEDRYVAPEGFPRLQSRPNLRPPSFHPAEADGAGRLRRGGVWFHAVHPRPSRPTASGGVGIKVVPLGGLV